MARTMMALAMILLSATSQAQPSKSVSTPPAASPISPYANEYAVLGDAVDTVDAKQPVLFLSNVPPIYPQAEKCEGITANILLLITINADGEPVDVRIERSSRNRHLDGATIEAAKRWKFKPTPKNGKATQRVVRVPVEFQPARSRCFMRDDSDIWVPVDQH